ncbi:RNA polymerase sigma factor [Posidoniimonas polymericola]|uniref:RNA polymerase sigma factor n=1 Tax=Posidoniimonas polymericola TaxID=2528002 RepID=A0A5C5YUR5_9BACT|nr:sigma-70 family RNA polymerase sigma factor [Posidoniimonas polymericola]TWT78561.1 RNA polymerase sigma factor [Posidoniimonas polymericola]
MNSSGAPNPSGKQSSRTWDELLIAARNGDDDALGAICQRLYGYLLVVARRGIGSDLAAKVGASDVVQQSMMEAHQDFARFDGANEEEFRAWIGLLLQRNLQDVGRRYRGAARRDIGREIGIDSRQTLPIASSEPNASRIARRRETDEELARAVEGLPPRQRQIVELRHRDNIPYDQIAAQLATTEEAARKLYSRAVIKLRQKLIPTDGS